MHFIENTPGWESFDEPHRVRDRSRTRDIAIEGHIGKSRGLTDRLRQGRLTALTGTMDQHDRRIHQRFFHTRPEKARVVILHNYWQSVA